MSAPTPAQPTDPEGVLFPFYGSGMLHPLAPPEGYEWVGPARTVREARPIPEPTVDVRLTMTVERTKELAEWSGHAELTAACREALSREGLT